jgi:pimeloyl-ACP methyl ester carboxylesterase
MPETERAKMLALYPQAQVKLFEGGGHGVALSQQKEYFAAIDDFLSPQG